jgi:type I restriction enzyme S subunit
VRIVEKISFDTGRIQLRSNGSTRTGMILVRPGDLVVSGINAAKGAIAIYDPEGMEPVAATIHYGAYIPNLDRVDIRFLWWMLRSRLFQELLNEYLPGGIKTELKAKRLLSVPVPMPPLAEQRRIVARIEELAAQINEARTLRQQAAEEAEALKKSALSHKLTAAAKKFGTVPMAKVAKCAAGFGFPQGLQGRTGLQYPFVKVSDMNLPENQRAVTTAQNWIDENDIQELGLRIYPVGTVIFPKIGGAIATNKRRVLALPATFDNNVMGLIPSEMVSCEYLLAFMESFDLTELQAGTSVPAISQGKVEAIEIPLPPIPEQRRIVEELDALQAQVHRLKALQAETAAELDALLPAILDRAFKAEL